LTALLCTGVAICSAAGFLWWEGMASHASLDPGQVEAESSRPLGEPAAAIAPVSREPKATEIETAALVATSELPVRDLIDLARRLQGITEPLSAHAWGGETSPTAAPVYAVGDAARFWVHDVRDNSFFTSTAILQYETPHAYWWVEEGYMGDGRGKVNAKALARSAERFENQTFPTSRRYFGSEWTPGIDGDPHVYIFLGHVPGVGGYFSGPDEYPTLIRPRSNQHEMFYINLENALPGSDYFDGILAHEFQHMIHWAMDRNEDTWVNEGLAELAAQVNGYDVGGSEYAFSLAADTQLTAWGELDNSASHYGASYLFLAYFLDLYGEQAVRQLVAEPLNGTVGFEAVLDGLDAIHGDFEELFADWVIANYLDSPSHGAGRYGYADLRLERPRYAARHASFPVNERATIHQYAADYILVEGEGDLHVEFEGNTVVSLLGNQTHSGEYQWWSSRGDDGDATLTRFFDLTAVEKATLEAWMWYDLEADYDYAYVQVSTDGGKTWNLLANDHTTTSNPSGNSYGPAFTGRSGGGEEARWSKETFDLTPFAGQQVLIRFEVITDEALNRPGLALDDIALPEIGYSYDAELPEGRGGDTDGWQADGWLRVTDHVPQEFLVQVITLGPEIRIRRMPLNEFMQGSLTLRRLGEPAWSGGGKERAVLVVSALAPATTERAGYSYRITQSSPSASHTSKAARRGQP
jgi:hypothetical protein